MSMTTLQRVAELTGGQLVGADAAFASVSTDTRTLQPGELFFALRGERFDAQQFLDEAARCGAAGAVTDRLPDISLPYIAVNDTRLALADFARGWRDQFRIPVVAITGSNGKTTVKELVAAVLRITHGGNTTSSVLATTGNLNNEIGVPLTLLRLRPGHAAAVIEMGASGPGEIARLASIAVPDVAVITNAARAHLEGFGSLAGVAAAKGEIIDQLAADGIAVLNRDDAYFTEWSARVGVRRCISFGMTASANFHSGPVRQVWHESRPAFQFELHTPSGTIAVTLPLAGRQNISNALAAAAAAMAAGASLEDVQAGFASSANVAGRMRAFRHASGAVIFDDSYNANPDSVAAAINSLRALDGEAWLVLGDMGELGSNAAVLHRGVGELARASGIRGLLCAGELSRETAAGFGDDARWFAAPDQLEQALLQELVSGRNVLIKASRFMRFDRLVKRIETEMQFTAQKEEV